MIMLRRLKMKKGKIINFEFLWDFDTVIEIDATKILLKDIEEAAKNGFNVILGIMLNEGILPYDTLSCVKMFEKLKLLETKLQIEIILVSAVGTKFKSIEVPFQVIDFNYHARLVYNAYADKNFEKRQSDKFLFLGGCSTRPNRIGLLSKFYNKNMLDNMEWSFFPPTYPADKNYCRNYLKDFSESEYMNFIKTVDKKFDNVYADVTYLIHDADQKHGDEWFDIKKSDFFKSPGYIDQAIFRRTKFSIISEGPNFWSNNHEFITIITWRTIINRHPFIFAGHPDQFKYIKSLGFKTFEEYLCIPDYAYIENEQDRLSAVVENAKHLLNNFSSEIYNDVEYNYNRYIEIISAQEKLFEHFIKDLGIDAEEIHYYLNQTGLAHLVRDVDV